jgi:selenocysteine lyase/cysteine desulfurase
VDIDINEVKADFVCFAGHKTPYGPFGIGGFIAKECNLNVTFAGGTGSNSLNLNMPEMAPDKYEFGSKNIVAIAGLNEALKCLKPESALIHEREVMQHLVSGLKKNKDVIIYQSSSDPDKQVGVLSFNVKGLKSEDVGMILDEDFDIAVRTGYHCAPYIHELLKDEVYLGTVRVGLSQFTTVEEINTLIDALDEIARS